MLLSSISRTCRIFPRLRISVLSSRLVSHKLSTPGDAGRRAQELAQELDSNHNQIDTLLAHAGVKGTENIPLAPTLEFATTYTRPAEGPYGEGGVIYSRMDNPTRRLLEETVYKLECGSNEQHRPDMTCAFASGMMAASSIVLAHQTPLTVLLAEDVYHGVSTVLADVFQERFGIQVQRVDMMQLAAFARHLKDVVASSDNILVWLETPSNPRCDVIDLESIVNIVQRRRETSGASITTVVDSTLAPPVIQQPLKWGVDVVMHSGTKSLGGHSDVLLGITTASPFTPQGRKIGPLLRQVQVSVGGVASPMDSWLTLRGLRTLSVRAERQSSTALLLAQHLETLSEAYSITAVHYPGLKSHPKHAVAKRQMIDSNFGGVLSVEFQSEHLAMAFAGALRTIHRATSLGGTETLIEHRASIEPPDRVVSPPGLLRISVGLEDANDLLKDVDQALQIVKQVEQELS